MPEQHLEDAWLPLRESRAELADALGAMQPPHGQDEHTFPRSRLFRAVLQQKGGIFLVAFVLALWFGNPRLAGRLARRVPLELIATRLLPLLR
jgi:hypothetical protein